MNIQELPIVRIDPDRLVMGRQPRGDTSVELGADAILPSIRKFGVQVPLLVCDHTCEMGFGIVLSVGQYGIIEGHCRTVASRNAKRIDPKQFEVVSPGGIPARVLSDLTAAEVMALKNDNQQKPRLKWEEVRGIAEVIRSRPEAKKEEILTRFRQEIDGIFPKSSEGKLGESTNFTRKAKAAMEAGNFELARYNQDASEAAWIEGRYGVWQMLQCLGRGPRVVCDILAAEENGDTVEGYPILPKIRSSYASKDIVALEAAHKADKENSPLTVDADHTGPLFAEAIKPMLAKALEVPERPVRALNRSDAAALKPELPSEGMKALLMRVYKLDGHELVDYRELGEIAKFAEIIHLNPKTSVSVPKAFDLKATINKDGTVTFLLGDLDALIEEAASAWQKDQRQRDKEAAAAAAAAVPTAVKPETETPEPKKDKIRK